MKYIRTEDKIYGFVKGIVSSIEHDEEVGAYSIYYFDDDKGEHMEQDGKGGHSMDSVWDDEIVAEADTIEELCDEFVSITDDLTPEILVPKYISPKDTLEIAWKNRLEDEMCYKNVIIYGAIWTEWGLKYVAKMNEKGELCLI